MGKDDNIPKIKSIVVDAECDQSTGRCGWQGIAPYAGNLLLFRKGPFQGGTNNIVEYIAVVHGLAYAKKHGMPYPVYTDSQTAMAWVRNKNPNTKAPRTKESALLFEIMDRATNWLLQNPDHNMVLKWRTKEWGENPADFGNKQ